MPESNDRRFSVLMNALADSVAEAPDEDIVKETQDHSPDQIRRVLFEGVAKFRRARLAMARKEYEERTSAYRVRPFHLPESPELRLGLLRFAMSQHSQVADMVTAQFREFGQMMDEDVQSLLRQLHALGLLPEDQKDEE